MAFKPGYLGYFGLDSAAGSIVDLSGYLDNVGVPQNVDTLETSVFGVTAKQFIAGMTDGDTISISGPYDVTLHTHITGMKAAQSAGTTSFSYIWGPGGSVASQAKVSGEAILTGYELSSGTGGRAEWSGSLQVTGTVTNGTF
ncbi:MAG TPA: hypothetical protein VMY16_09450 [Ilumatobacteraceae bacterium]|nr:hypothetical protein [Ilumatobacteraceae bacterium]HUV18016.1 hypothetical protein [Ilumatobacteraceae bacterium]